MNATEAAKEIRRSVFRSIDRLSKNPDFSEVVSSYSVLTHYHLRKLAETNPEYVPQVRRALVNLL